MTICTPDNTLRVATDNDVEINGVRIGKGDWLEHMFLEPQSIGIGIGIRLFNRFG